MGLPVVVDSIESYFADISRFPLLDRAEEHRLAVALHEDGDLDAAAALVTANLRFVVKIALKYRNYGCALKDLIQEGNIGLMTAVKKFNPYKGSRLITYAVWWIKSCIQEFIMKTRGMVRHGSKALKKKLFYKNDKELIEGDSLKALPADGAHAKMIDLKDLSLDAPLADGSGSTHLDMLPDLGPHHTELIAESEEAAIIKEDVGSALANLNKNERYVMENRVMADEPMSLQAIGTVLSITRERVRQIEKAALGKLKDTLAPQPA